MRSSSMLGVLLGCVLTMGLVGGAALWMSRGDLIDRCARAAPSDLRDDQVSLTFDRDYVHGTLTCGYDSVDGRDSRTSVVPLYR